MYGESLLNFADLYYYGKGVAQSSTKALLFYKRASIFTLENNTIVMDIAMCNVAKMYYYGEGTEKSISEAIKWYKKAVAETDSIFAEFNLKRIENGENVFDNLFEYVCWCELDENVHSSYIQYSLYHYYSYGISLKKSIDKANLYLKLSAEGGYYKSQYILYYLLNISSIN